MPGVTGMSLSEIILVGAFFITAYGPFSSRSENDAHNKNGVLTIESKYFIFVCPRVKEDKPTEDCGALYLASRKAGTVLVELEFHGFPDLHQRSFILKQRQLEIVMVTTETSLLKRGEAGVFSLTGNGSFSVTALVDWPLIGQDFYHPVPVEAWGLSYYILSYAVNPIMIILTEKQDAEVKIKFRYNQGKYSDYIKPLNDFSLYTPQGHVNGLSTISFTIPRLRAWHLRDCYISSSSTKAKRVDFTGSYLKSKQRIGVLAGCCLCGSLPFPSCQSKSPLDKPGTFKPSIEMLMPESTAGMSFIIFKTPRETLDSIKLVATKNNSVATVMGKYGLLNLILDGAGEWRVVTDVKKPFIIRSTQPIQVMYRMESTCFDNPADVGDPTASIIVPNELFYHTYFFGIPYDTNGTNLAVRIILILKKSMEIGVKNAVVWGDTMNITGADEWKQESYTTSSRYEEVYEVNSKPFGCYLILVESSKGMMAPVGFVAAPIRNPCTRSVSSMQQYDLVDNDCDDAIDEEYPNGLDDDGDDEIDEDVGDFPRADGEWGSWEAQCHLTCGKITGQQVKRRYCDSPQPSLYGKDCKGTFTSHDGVSCVDTHTECQEDDDTKESPPDDDTTESPPDTTDSPPECPTNCKDMCQAVSGQCSGCKPGFALGKDKKCTEACPQFTYGENCSNSCKVKCTGIDCVERINGTCRERTEKSTIGSREKTDMNFLLIIGALIGFASLGIICLIFNTNTFDESLEPEKVGDLL